MIWSDQCQEAFIHLKECLVEASVLAFPDFHEPFLLETDASALGLGAVLSQVHKELGKRPVAFACRTLQTHERNYGIMEFEALGVYSVGCEAL